MVSRVKIRLLLFIAFCFTFHAFPANFRTVEARINANDPVWKKYTAKTLDRLPGFKFNKEPQKNKFGSWMVNRQKSTGFFRVEKINGRWWFIDPEGYPFIHRAVVAFHPGKSPVQKESYNSNFGSTQKWLDNQMSMLRSYGFNGVGAWSQTEELRLHDSPLVYTVIVSPMSMYKAEHRKKYNGKYLYHGWQGYRFDLPMVFDPEFDVYVEKAVSAIAVYRNDKNLLGYFTDNEIPWVNSALDRHLTLLAKDEAGYIHAKRWLDERKQKSAGIEDVNDEDRAEFLAFMLETYLKKVTTALRKYDPDHLYLGCRFNQENEELKNAAMFKVAGKYMDVISINHYRKWEPVQWILNNWAEWSDRPFIITEWYTKGEDTPLPNMTGAGWNVRTQKERGYFYQNFCIELMKSKNCIGWHWFKYQDNDPNDMNADVSNRDSNKGVVDSQYRPYTDLLQQMKIINDNTYNLIQWWDKRIPVIDF